MLTLGILLGDVTLRSLVETYDSNL